VKRSTNEIGKEALDAQREHWQATFASRPEMFGAMPSEPAVKAAELFTKERRQKVLELGCGQGRDTLFLAGGGFDVTALDYSERGLEDIREKAEQVGLSFRLATTCHDIRKRLPFDAGSFDACFSHMVYCMALTTAELEALSAEIRRVLKPDGLNVYTARNTQDPDYRTGIHRGDEIYELDGGFIVHFFSGEKVAQLARGYQLLNVEEFEEGPLPKRLYLVTQRRED
jgi:SAM-dependent methyltransferase